MVEYDGTDFHGFQKQPGLPTVQEALERKLSAVCGHDAAVVGAGRTDTGVHALGQVIHFDTMGRIPADRVAAACSSFPPDSVVLRRVEETTPEFHARFDAHRRTYHYYFTREEPLPFIRQYVAHQPQLRADGVERMRAALPALLGQHDFASFCASAWEGGSTVRTVYRAEIEERGRLVRVALTADAFVHSMARVVVGTLWEIAGGRKEPGALAAALAAKSRSAAGATAPARGLFLARVEYPDGYPGPETEPGWIIQFD